MSLAEKVSEDVKSALKSGDKKIGNSKISFF